MPLRKFLSLTSTPKWPKAYGFEIYGHGPTYIVSVQPGSTASEAGLTPGDQLLEVDGQDVSTMAAPAVKALARHSRQQPPALEVVACVNRLVLEPRPLMGYGFAVLNNRPVVVGSVEYGGPAFEAGLRVGDVILEVNGRLAQRVETVGSVLSERPSQLSLLTIPVGRSGNLLHVDKGLSQLPPSDPRVHRAKDLYDKLGEVMGEDYEGKMTVVSILKQYAEDRDIDILCGSLGSVLTTPRSRAILRHIRTLVTPHQRAVFDERMMMVRGGGSELGSPVHSHYAPSVGPGSPSHNPYGHHPSPGHSPRPSVGPQATPVTHTVGTKKLIQIIRENGCFGFTVKGFSPAYIESVDEGGPADIAGADAGDFIIRINGLDVRRCEHDRLVDLLQESGATPTLEILRCQAGQQPVLSPAGSLASLNTFSSESSHASDLLPFEQHHKDGAGKTFTQHAEFLLTPKERLLLKRTLQQYELNRDVVSLYGSLEPVLDTPSKQTLWKFILVTLQSPHRDYVLHRVGLPPHVLTELLDQHSSENGHRLPMFASKLSKEAERVLSIRQTESVSEATAAAGATTAGVPSSFQSNIDFLLTSTERLQFNDAIEAYQESKDLEALLEVLGLILDTPSKRVLWRHVLPRLTPAHQGVVRHMMDIPDTTSVSGLSLPAMESYIGSYDDDNSQQHVDIATNTDEDVLFGTENDTHAKDGDSSDDEKESSDGSGSESASPRASSVKQQGKAASRDDQALMEELAATRRAVEEVKEAIRGRAQDKDVYSDTVDNDDDDSASNMDSKHFVTIIPVGYPGFDLSHRPFYSKEMDSPEFQKFRKFASKKPETETESTKQRGFHGVKFKDTEDGDSSDSDRETLFPLQSKSSRHERESVTQHRTAMVALQALDDVMAGEASSDADQDSPRHQQMTSSAQMGSHARRASTSNPAVTFAARPVPISYKTHTHKEPDSVS